MTPVELLLEVKDRFNLLYIDDEELLLRKLKASLGAYQDRAGSTKTLKANSNLVEIPADADGVYHATGVDGMFFDIEDNGDGFWEIESSGIPPFKIKYLINLRGLDFDKDHIPTGCISLVADHLYATINYLNVERDRFIKQASDLPTDSILSESELEQSIKDVEERMFDDSSLIMMMSV